MTNLLLNTDSYKASHFLQYPPGTTYVSSYIESRPRSDQDGEIVFFGLQMFIQEYLFEPITRRDIREAKEVFAAHGVPFNEEGWQYILDTYDGYLPLVIEALPEGTVHKPGVPMVQVRNTDPLVPWLTSYMETALLRAVWYPSTVATKSRNGKKIIMDFLNRTSDDPEGQIAFKLHDFGARGCTAMEQAGLGGAAHLVNFMGTDTLTGVLYARKYYGGVEMPGYSIPAAEHSTITSWGKQFEKEAYANMLEAFPTGLVAVVSDSYDYKRAVDVLWGKELRQQVLDRDGTLVIRPDSGDPSEMILYALESLGASYGYTTNSKGFKVLHPKVRLIQGDGIDLNSMTAILMDMHFHGWSADNVAFGMGAGLLQQVNRDTLRFAMKASARCGDFGWVEVFKDPKTDPGKSSKRGIQQVYRGVDGELVVEHTISPITDPLNLLQPVYEMRPGWDMPNIASDSFDAIRNRAAV